MRWRRGDPRKYAPGDRVMMRNDPDRTGTIRSHGTSNPTYDGGDWVYQVEWDTPPPLPWFGQQQLETIPASRADGGQ